MLVHTYICANEDEMNKHKETGWHGTLADYAALKFSQWHYEMLPNATIRGVESSFWTDTVKPRMDNSNTWYSRRSIQLSIWMESDRPVPVKVELNEKGMKEMKELLDKECFLKNKYIWLVSELDDKGFGVLSPTPTSLHRKYFHKSCFEIIED